MIRVKIEIKKLLAWNEKTTKRMEPRALSEATKIGFDLNWAVFGQFWVDLGQTESYVGLQRVRRNLKLW